MKNVLKHYNSISYKDFSHFSILNLNRRTNQCYRIAPIKICFPPPVPQGGGRFIDQQIRGEKRVQGIPCQGGGGGTESLRLG